MTTSLSRRNFLNVLAGGAAATGLTACGAPYDSRPQVDLGAINAQPAFSQGGELFAYANIYAPVSDGGFELPAVPYQRMDPQFLRQIIDDPTGEMPGTIVVDTSRRFLYLVRENGKAIRYGVGIGRAGFSWSGRAIIQFKKSWPRWFPPSDMIKRQPELKRYSAKNGGMAPGNRNPLGARALYIFKDGRDTLYRLHGNPEWWSIGKAVSSGCVRLMNQDIIDLYERVPAKTPILVV